MKKLILGCALAAFGLSVSTASALGFGLGSNCCPRYDSCCCEDNGFDGLYIGGNLGIASHTAHRNDLDGFLVGNSGWTAIDTAFTGGAQIGYDWQCNNKLVGLVWDWNGANISKRLRNGTDSLGPIHIDNRLDWYTTIRARTGLTLCDSLLYITFGAVATRFHARWVNEGGESMNTRFRHGDTRWGWTGGVGTECLVCNNWSAGFELLFMHFAHREKTFTANGSQFTFGHSDSAWLGRFLVNYRFGDLFCGGGW